MCSEETFHFHEFHGLLGGILSTLLLCLLRWLALADRRLRRSSHTQFIWLGGGLTRYLAWYFPALENLRNYCYLVVYISRKLYVGKKYIFSYYQHFATLWRSVEIKSLFFLIPTWPLKQPDACIIPLVVDLTDQEKDIGLFRVFVNFLCENMYITCIYLLMLNQKWHFILLN